MASGEVNDRRVFRTKESITSAGLANSNAKVFPAGTLMLAMNGQGHTRGMVARLEIDAACNQSLAALLPGPDLDRSFLFQVLDSSYEDIRNLTGDGRAGLNLHLIRQIPLVLPPLPEQRAIAAVLDAIDAAIEKTEQVIGATEALRRALVQDLLSHGLPGRHGEYKQVTGVGRIPAYWDVVRLGDAAEVVAGFALGPERAPGPGARPYLTVANVQAGWIELSDRRCMKVSDREYAARHLVVGDIVLVEGHANLAELGRCAIVPPAAEGFTFQNHVFRVRPDLAEWDERFVCAFINGR
jgi:type I restriction enzyme S subunit